MKPPPLHLCFVVAAILVVVTSLWMIAMSMRMFLFAKEEKSRNNERAMLVKRPILHNQRAHFHVQLFLDLQFVDESLAMDFETLDETNPNIQHFCRAIQTQVGLVSSVLYTHLSVDESVLFFSCRHTCLFSFSHCVCHFHSCLGLWQHCDTGGECVQFYHCQGHFGQ